MNWDDPQEYIFNRRQLLAKTLCPTCGLHPKLMHEDRPAWWVCRCGHSFIKEPDHEPITLPDGSEIHNGLIYSPRKDYSRKRERFYQLFDAHPETATELMVKVQRSRLKDKIPHKEDNVVDFDTVRLRRGAKIRIPNNYLPPRCLRMWQKGDLSSIEAYAAAMYVYGVRTNFILWDVGTNFPQHEKVQTSVRVRSSPGRTIFAAGIKPRIKMILDYCLIEEGAFINVPGLSSKTRVKRHREGKRLFRSALRDFSETAHLPASSSRD